MPHDTPPGTTRFAIDTNPGSAPRTPMLIDTDPGVDDALALLMAFNDPGVDVVGLTIAAGNVGLAHTVANALRVCELVGRDTPVFAGCAAPLLHPAPDASHVHGDDGFGDVGLAPASGQARPEHAALAILRLSHAHAGALQLVMLGPLTNLAVALALDPTLPGRIARIVVMGGAVTGQGNTTPSAEFNIGFDPEAAHLVFAAFDRIELADWEAVVAHGIDHATFESWLQAPTPAARFYAAISARTRAWSAGLRGSRWHCADALAMAVALQPQGVLEWAERPLAIELRGTLTRGATVVDWGRTGAGRANAAIAMRYEQGRFEGLMQAALGVG